MYTYTWYQWLTFFYLYCFLGWIFESSYVSILQRRPVNRGFLRIPLLPLYGSGAVMMLWVSLPFQDNLILTYLSGVVGATALEYLTGLAMESLFKIRYWDYSHKKYNVHGYICLESSLFWGVLTILMTHIVHRPIARAVLAIPAGQDILFVTAVSAVFLYDTVVCTREALALGRSLEAMERFRRELENLQVQTSLLKMEAGDRLAAASEKLETQKGKLASLLVKARNAQKIDTIGEFLDTVKPLFGREREKKELAKVFQALRIEVNQEMEALKEMLYAATEALRPGGRLVIITYHSLEDRMVKNIMKTGNVEGKAEKDFYGNVQTPFRLVNNKVITPDEEEIANNPRSRSAKLRIAEKL